MLSVVIDVTEYREAERATTAARLAAERRTKSDIATLRALMNALSDVVENGSGAAGAALVRHMIEHPDAETEDAP